jgi:adenylyltransferase/sulfurtransferase
MYRLPKAMPSADEAIVPFNPNEHVILPQVLKQMIDKGQDFVLLDVREQHEYETAHIEGTRFIPIGQIPHRASELNPYDEIVVYCHRGMRSLDAAYLLQQIGFKHVSSLVGGIDRWSKEIDPNVRQY